MDRGVASVGWTAGWRVPVTRVDPVTDPAVLAPDLESADDQTLVRAFVNGRREAFDVIVVRYRKPIYQLCYRFTGNHEDAADLAQDVFVRAFKGLPRFKGDSALGTWLYRIAVNASLNRAAVKRPLLDPIESVEPADDSVRDPVDRLIAGEDARRIRAAVRRLPPKQQAALVLRVYHELSHDEIARTLGSSVGAVKANVFHALGNLRRLLQR